jgi:hypothetical protein
LEGTSKPGVIISSSLTIPQIYFIFIGIDLAAVGFTYMFFPEFRHLSLEEIDLVFETSGTRPVKVANKLQKAKDEKRREELSRA